MNILFSILLTLFEIVPKGDAFIKPQTRRDSIYVADRLEYGFELDNVRKGTELALPDAMAMSNDTLTVVEDWKLDTLKIRRRKGLMDIRGRIVVAPFEEGDYAMPHIFLLRREGGKIDTLRFNSVVFHVAEFPIDSARVARNELQPLVRYPLTFKELLPWLLGGLFLLGLLAAGISMWLARARRKEYELTHEPAHITALRKLDAYRGNGFWAPEKQKAFYSGVTDTLKAYMEARFGVDAPEMTTAEVFDALKGAKGLPEDVYGNTKELFETADLIKFAKFTAPDEYNAKVVPTAVRFVTETYQNALEEEPEGDVL